MGLWQGHVPGSQKPVLWGNLRKGWQDCLRRNSSVAVPDDLACDGRNSDFKDR